MPAPGTLPFDVALADACCPRPACRRIDSVPLLTKRESRCYNRPGPWRTAHFCVLQGEAGGITVPNDVMYDEHGRREWWGSKASRYFPLLDALHTHRLRDYLADLQAGIVIAVVMVPQAIAFASLAGLPPVVGLHTAIVTILIYALVGPSRQMVVGPTSVASLMVALSLAPLHLAPAHYVTGAIVLALVTGVFFLLLGLFRAGHLENFISQPVLLGFTSAMVLIIIIAQAPTLMGIHLSHGSGSHRVILTLLELLLNAAATQWATLAIGVVGIASIIICRRISPLLPGPLINVFLGAGMLIVVRRFWGQSVDVVGDMQRTLPAFVPPYPLDLPVDNGTGMLTALVRTGLAIGVVTYVQSISIAKIMAGRTGRRIDANQELIALGLANLGGALFRCYPAAGSLSQSSVSYRAGARSQLACVIAAVVALLTLVALSPYLSYVPRACLAAIVIVSVTNLFDLRSIIRAFRVKSGDGSVIVATFLATVFLNMDTGILVGVALSLGIILWRTARPRISYDTAPVRTPDAGSGGAPIGMTEDAGTIVVAVEGPLLFMSASHVESAVINLLADRPDTKRVILDATAISDLDTTGEKILWDLLRMMMLKEIDFAIAGATPTVTDVMRRAGFCQFLGEENFYRSLPDAIAARHGAA